MNLFLILAFLFMSGSLIGWSIELFTADTSTLPIKSAAG